jgi:outer membrane immunogenic protein
MRKILLASVAALGLAGTASAADLAVRAPLAPVPLFSWAGCYLGINGGWVGGRDKFNQHTFFRDLRPNHPVLPAVDPVSYSSDESAGTFGGQFGCQYQWGAVVLGGEWDLNWSGLKEDNYASLTGTNPDIFTIYGFPPDRFWSEHTHKQVDWFSTARVRLGWAAWDRFLIYGTGGLALANYDAYTQYNFWANDPDPVIGQLPTNFGSYRENRIGWTVGGGFEWAFASNWTAKAEFLYLDFGEFSYTAPCQPAFCIGQVALDRVTHIDAKEYVARVGINYLFHLGPPAVAPVYARY